jgi:O-succinylbenzoate synthase
VESIQITQVSVVRLPLRSRFRGIEYREALIFKGSRRYSEFSPFLEYGDDEASTWLKAALEFANDPLPIPVRQLIPINATLPAVRPDQVVETLQAFGQFRTIKIKVAEAGQDLDQDLARIAQAHKSFPDASLRLDANGNYSVAQAMKIIKAIAHLPIEYFEQPVASIDELVKLRQQIATAEIQMKIAADESIRKQSDPLQVAVAGAADIAVLKVQPLGGIKRSLAIASESGLESVVSSALESSIGISHGLHLAASLPNLDFDCGLGTASLMAKDISRNPLIAVNGYLELDEPDVDAGLVSELAVESERKIWWQQRLDRCLKLL